MSTPGMREPMPVEDDNALLDLVARTLNGGPLNASHKSVWIREKAARLIDAIEDAGYRIVRDA